MGLCLLSVTSACRRAPVGETGADDEASEGAETDDDAGAELAACREALDARRWSERVSAGYEVSCQVADAGIECWGNDARDIVRDAPSGSFAQVAVGGTHACARRSDGQLECWGSGFRGGGPPEGEFVAVFVAIDGSDYPSGAIRDDGRWLRFHPHDSSVHSPEVAYLDFGFGSRLNCGLRPDCSLGCSGGSGFGISTPTGQFLDVECEGLNCCALAIDGNVSCFGETANSDRALPEQPQGYWRIAMSFDSLCGITNDRRLVCEGNLASPPPDDPALRFKEVSGGETHMCALTLADTLICWGSNEHGESTPPD